MQYESLVRKIENIIVSMPQEPIVLAPDVEGMTSPKVRCLLNAIVASEPCSRHLEVGSYKGATLVSAMINNHHASAIAYEDFSEYSVQNELEANVNRHRHELGAVRLFYQDFFEVDIPEDMLPITSFFYDGDHSSESQKKAVLRAMDLCDEALVFIVDDWNWSDVRKGTWDGINEARCCRFAFWELMAKHNWDDAEFHNGLGVFVLSCVSRE